MEEINLNSIRSLRNLVSELGSAALEEVIAKLIKIKDEKLQQEQQAKEELDKRRAFADQMLATLKQHSMSVEDLLSVSQSQEHKPKRNIKPKYLYHDVDGTELKWSGQGKTPRKFLEAMQRNGNDKEAYRIHDE